MTHELSFVLGVVAGIIIFGVTLLLTSDLPNRVDVKLCMDKSNYELCMERLGHKL